MRWRARVVTYDAVAAATVPPGSPNGKSATVEDSRAIREVLDALALSTEPVDRAPPPSPSVDATPPPNVYA